MVPVGSSVMLELILTVHSYHVFKYPDNEAMKKYFYLVKRFIVVSLICILEFEISVLYENE